MTARFDPILFDLDGTLVDSRADIAAAVNRTLTGLDLPPLPETQITRYVGDGVRRLMERVLASAGRMEVDEAVLLFKADYRRHCLVETHLYPGIPELLATLAGRRLGLVTNKPVEFARVVLEGLGVLTHFGAVVGGDEAALKPAPEPLRLALERLGVCTPGALMVGDSANDVLAARAAGLPGCGVTWGFDGGEGLRHAAPDFVCDTPAELGELLAAFSGAERTAFVKEDP